MNLSVPELPFSRYRLVLKAAKDYQYRGFLGSAWRGVFGHALKKAVCVTKCAVCRDCLLYRSCAYPYIFETPLPANAEKLRKYETIPHPFILHPDWSSGASTASLSLEFTLIGRANSYLPYVLYAFTEAARGGLQRGPAMEIAELLQQSGPGFGEWKTVRRGTGPLEPLPMLSRSTPNTPTSIRIRFLTPLRLRSNDQYITPDRFRFSHFFTSLLGRVSSLQYFHAERPLETDFARLSMQARAIEFDSADVRWTDWSRYSSRQKAELQMGGLLGTVSLTAPVIEDFWPYLWLGQFIHAGKGATMGLGRYVVEETGRLAD